MSFSEGDNTLLLAIVKDNSATALRSFTSIQSNDDANFGNTETFFTSPDQIESSVITEISSPFVDADDRISGIAREKTTNNTFLFTSLDNTTEKIQSTAGGFSRVFSIDDVFFFDKKATNGNHQIFRQSGIQTPSEELTNDEEDRLLQDVNDITGTVLVFIRSDDNQIYVQDSRSGATINQQITDDEDAVFSSVRIAQTNDTTLTLLAIREKDDEKDLVFMNAQLALNLKEHLIVDTEKIIESERTDTINFPDIALGEILQPAEITLSR